MVTSCEKFSIGSTSPAEGDEADNDKDKNLSNDSGSGSGSGDEFEKFEKQATKKSAETETYYVGDAGDERKKRRLDDTDRWYLDVGKSDDVKQKEADAQEDVPEQRCDREGGAEKGEREGAEKEGKTEEKTPAASSSSSDHKKNVNSHNAYPNVSPKNANSGEKIPEWRALRPPWISMEY